MNILNNSSLQLWVARHGETEWAKLLKHTGRTDIPLTNLGERQARGLKPLLAKQRFDRVWCSPLSRAKETALLAGFAAENGVEYVDDLMEWDYGVFEGKTRVELRQSLGEFDIWTTPVTGGESLAEVAARAERVLSRLEAAGGRCLLFSHGHFLRILTARWLGLPPDGGRLFYLDPAGLSVLGHEHEQRVVQSWNLGGLAE